MKVVNGMKDINGYFIEFYSPHPMKDETDNRSTFFTGFYDDLEQYNISKFQAVLYQDFVFQEMKFKKHPDDVIIFSNYFDKISFYAIQWPEIDLNKTYINDSLNNKTYNLNTGDYINFDIISREDLLDNYYIFYTTGTDIIRLFTPENNYLVFHLIVIYKSTSYTETEINNNFDKNDGVLNEDFPLLVKKKNEFLFNCNQYTIVSLQQNIIILSLSDNVKINFKIENITN